MERLGVTNIFVEKYISTDWADEFQTRHSRVLRDLPKWVPRIHFFKSDTMGSARLRRQDLLRIADLVANGVEYLGFCVVRPYQPGPFAPPSIGETVLMPPRTALRVLPSIGDMAQVSDSLPTCCRTNFHAHILGREIDVAGMPFIQQDRAVSVCAEADLWMIARYMHELGHVRRYRPSEMERLAQKSGPTSPTREGLEAHQIFTALHEMGLHPDLVSPANAFDAVSLISAHTWSGVPVIASLGNKGRTNHVVTIVGCTYSRNRRSWDFRPRDFPVSMADYVSHVLVHDDQKGPYHSLAVGSRKSRDDRFHRLTLNGQPVFDLVFPGYPRVHLREEDVRLIAREWTQSIIPEQFMWPGGRMWSKNDMQKYVLRPYLLRSDLFKRRAWEIGSQVYGFWHGRRGDMPRQWGPLDWGAEYYVQQMLPRFVWVVDFVTPPEDVADPLLTDMVWGEMVFDSTAHFQDSMSSLLSFRLLGRMMWLDEPGEERPNRRVSWATRDYDSRDWSGAPDLYSGPYPSFLARPGVYGSK